jgi:hypothetical protein
MNISRNRLIGLAALSLILYAIMAVRPWVSTSSAQPGGAYGYLHFRAGSCSVEGGQGVIDTRNGNMWCVPKDGSAPIYQGTLNLAAIPATAPKR